MKSGWHDHYCPKCKHGFICQKLTHCNDPWETPCPDHREPTVALIARDGMRLIKDKDGREIWSVKEGLIESRADEHYYSTGKRPGES